MIDLINNILVGKETQPRYNWRLFGQRLKRAYVVKFGYSNPEFEREVDRHILAMRTLDTDSHTRDIAEDWLKRITQFVEVSWIKPEANPLKDMMNEENRIKDKRILKGIWRQLI